MTEYHKLLDAMIELRDSAVDACQSCDDDDVQDKLDALSEACVKAALKGIQ